MASPEKKGRFLTSMREEYGAGNKPPSLAEATILNKIKADDWAAVEQFFSQLSVAEAGDVLDAITGNICRDSAACKRLRDAYCEGVKKYLSSENETKKNEILAQIRARA